MSLAVHDDENRWMIRFEQQFGSFRYHLKQDAVNPPINFRALSSRPVCLQNSKTVTVETRNLAVDHPGECTGRGA